jgi:hypothetical protein
MQEAVAVVTPKKRTGPRPTLARLLSLIRSETHHKVLEANPEMNYPACASPRASRPVSLVDPGGLLRPAAPGLNRGHRP